MGDLWNYMTKEQQELVLRIIDGNPGAMTVVIVLMHYSEWWDFMRLLSSSGIIGDKLWILYQDSFKFSDRELAEDLRKKLADRNSVGKKSKEIIWW